MARLKRTAIGGALFLSAAAPALAGEGGDITGRMAALVIQIAVILFAAWLGGRLFERAGLPSVLGELTAGILIGPYLVGGFAFPGFPHGLFPLQESFPISPELYGFATVASIVLLFLVGLETDLDIFLRFAGAGSAIGIGGVVASFVLGDLATVIFSRHVFGEAMGFSDPIPLFLGVVSTATSVGVSARILADKRKIDSPEGVTILAAAIIDDVLGIILLAIAVGVIKSGHFRWDQVGIVTARAIAVWLGFLGLGLALSQRLSKYLKILGDRGTISVMALALALLLSGIFEKSGLAMIIGAYVMGLTLSKTDLAFLIRDSLSILYRFFIPVFFCVMGMLVNPLDIFDARILFFSLIFSAIAVAAKLAGCGLPAFLFNFNRHGAGRIGMGMVPRGEVAMIIAGIGLSAGILEQESFGVAVVMTFITTLLPPLLFSRMLGKEILVLRREKDLKPRLEHLSFAIPNPETGNLLLDKVLEAFRREGFFVHRPDLRQQVYQVRKNETFITLSYTPSEIAFDCRQQDLVFVNTLIYEVLAELERVMRHLQGLSDRRNIGRQIFEPAACPLPPEQVRLGNHARLFNPAAVTIRLPGRNKEEILAALVNLFVRAGTISALQRPKVLAELLDRERDMSTGLQEGVAFPHARTPAVEHLACAAGISPEGVEFGSLDGAPARIFIATLIPESSPEPYLRLMADFSQYLSSEDNRRKLLECSRDHELFNLLQKV